MSVYFAQVGQYIKIGYSENPERRVRNLFKSTTRYGAPQDAPTRLADRHLIRAIEGDTTTEAAAHDALREFCVFTEWFIDEPEVRAFIASLPDDPGERPEFEPVRRPAGRFDWQADALLGFTQEEEDRLAAAVQHIFDGTYESPARATPGASGT